MLDIQRIRNRPDDVARALARRGLDHALDGVLELDGRRRAALAEVEALKKDRNDRSREIGATVKAGGDAGAARDGVRRIGERIAEIETDLAEVEARLGDALLGIPNLPDASVPDGRSSDDNVVVHTWGTPREFDFQPRAHWDLGVELGILDFERAAKLAGARFAVYLREGAALERALIQFMLDLQTREHGYVEVIPPFMVNAAALRGTGQLPKFEADLFRVEPGGFHLVPTAEVPLTNLHAGEILEPGTLPLAYTAYTPCFRSEAGSYGKDVRGLIRLHQFNKVELVHITAPEDSGTALERMTMHAEEVLRRLELPYRRVVLCAGDMGFSAVKTYDLEVWLPGQAAYREISSCSNCGDFQARRAAMRFRREIGGKPEFVHTLNGSGLAAGRTFVAVLENYQEADGSVTVPAVLRPYLGGLTRISRS